MGRFLAGFIVALLALALGGFAAVVLGLMPAGADQPPGLLERWAARRSLHETIARESHALASPLAATDATLLEGAKIYALDCLVCHGAADGRSSTLARGLYIQPPQLATDGVEDDPVGETYWKVKHGIRFTAMPAFGGSLREEQLWSVALFVGRLGHLPPPVAAVWNGLPSAAAAP